jgi:hypothetical protein
MRTTISTIVVCLLAVVMNSHSQTQSNAPVGSFGFQLNNVVGVLNIDGAGNVTGNYTSLNGGTTTVQSGTLAGTYSSNSNGIGGMNIAIDSGSNGNVTFSVVITDGGAGLLLLQTGSADQGNNGGGNGGGNNGGCSNNSLSGIARRQ